MKANTGSFDEIQAFLESQSPQKVAQFDCLSKDCCSDVAGRAHDALMKPLDFPSIESAIVSGDRVALALDPYVPQIADVVTGILKTLSMTDASDVDIVLWDEASDETIAAIQDVVGDSATVTKHDSSQRESLRYLAADQDATPLYLNRKLVDADFVLPVVASRVMDGQAGVDSTGIFPSLADSSSRLHDCQRRIDAASSQVDANELQIPWLLGVHLVVCVIVNSQGAVADVVAGTPHSIQGRLNQDDVSESGEQMRSDLVVASIDGNAQQQTWENAARVLVAASRHVASDGTIVLWTNLDQPPRGILVQLDDYSDAGSVLERFAELGKLANTDDETSSDFPLWDSQVGAAATLVRILSQHRVVLKSSLPDETIESMGIGVIKDQSELVRIAESFETVGVLRAAQFIGPAVDVPNGNVEALNNGD